MFEFFLPITKHVKSCFQRDLEPLYIFGKRHKELNFLKRLFYSHPSSEIINWSRNWYWQNRFEQIHNIPVFQLAEIRNIFTFIDKYEPLSFWTFEPYLLIMMLSQFLFIHNHQTSNRLHLLLHKSIQFRFLIQIMSCIAEQFQNLNHNFLRKILIKFSNSSYLHVYPS